MSLSIRINIWIDRITLVYGCPYLIVNMWLVTYTLLHHTDRNIPHYGGDEWNWLRGALCTIDRPYTPLINWLHHHIGSTHVCHHLFSKLPHYNAPTATKNIIAYLDSVGKKDMYNYDDRNPIKRVWDLASECYFVEQVEPDIWKFI